MPVFDVTFVVNTIVHHHVAAKDEKELTEFVEKYYGVGHGYYGPVSKELNDLITREISGGGFYVVCFVKPCSDIPDAIAGEVIRDIPTVLEAKTDIKVETSVKTETEKNPRG